MIKRLLATLLALFAAAAFAAVDVNQANPTELQSIKGIGPGTSAKIIEARSKAKFKDWGDLMDRVNGIGEKKALMMSGEGLTVSGQTYKSKTTSAATATKGPASPATKTAAAATPKLEKKPAPATKQ